MTGIARIPIYIRSLPLLAIPTLIYALLAAPSGQEGVGASLGAEMFTLALPSGDVWNVLWGQALMAGATLLLFVEIVRSARPVTSSMVENALALLLFSAQLVFFLIVPGFGTADFATIMGMTLLDFAAGAMVMIYSARRDVQYNVA
jgi:hypothetical protein